MTKDTFWIFVFCLPTVAVLTESVQTEHKTYVTDALSQNAFVIKTWTYSGPSMFFTVKKGNKTLISAFMDGVNSTKQDNRLLIKHNKSTEEVSLLLNNVTRSDEGLYKISTSTYENSAEESEMIQLNVLEPGEIKQGYSGENKLITEFVQESIVIPRLYHNYQLVAVLRGSDCDVSTNSPFFGRIRCSKDKDNNTTRIEIKNVTENDTGLYKVETEGNLTRRCFLNITGTYPNSASASIIVTPSDHFDENNSDQPSNITISTTMISNTVVHLPCLQSEPFYILPITMVAAVAIIILSFGFFIWIQQRNIKSFKAGQHIAQDECDPSLYLTPIASEPPLTVPTCQERKTDNSNIAQNKNIDPCTWLAEIISMDGYEVVDISNEDPEIKPELEEIIHESTENSYTPYSDTSGYLTVLGRRETTV